MVFPSEILKTWNRNIFYELQWRHGRTAVRTLFGWRMLGIFFICRIVSVISKLNDERMFTISLDLGCGNGCLRNPLLVLVLLLPSKNHLWTQNLASGESLELMCNSNLIPILFWSTVKQTHTLNRKMTLSVFEKLRHWFYFIHFSQ